MGKSLRNATTTILRKSPRLNPSIPKDYANDQKKRVRDSKKQLEFDYANSITKNPIGIQIFPNCVIWTKIISSKLPNKDILLGFDIIH